MEPMTLLSIASTAVSAMGAMQQADSQAASYQAQAQANDYNAIINKQNAEVASTQANAKEEAQRRHFRALQGQAVAGVAQSGTGFGGSNADVLEQNEINNELDALTIRYEGDMQARGLLAQSELDKYQANVSRQNASSAKSAGMMNAGAAILGGATNYYKWKNTPIASSSVGATGPGVW